MRGSQISAAIDNLTEKRDDEQEKGDQESADAREREIGSLQTLQLILGVVDSASDLLKGSVEAGKARDKAAKEREEASARREGWMIKMTGAMLGITVPLLIAAILTLAATYRDNDNETSAGASSRSGHHTAISTPTPSVRTTISTPTPSVPTTISTPTPSVRTTITPARKTTGKAGSTPRPK